MQMWLTLSAAGRGDSNLGHNCDRIRGHVQRGVRTGRRLLLQDLAAGEENGREHEELILYKRAREDCDKHCECFIYKEEGFL